MLNVRLSAATITTYEYIEKYYSQHGYSPTYMEMKAALKRPRGSLGADIEKLIRKGWLRHMEKGAARNLVPIKQPRVYYAERGNESDAF